MPADHKVSVGWQVVAQFIAIVDLWSAYRIRKLRKYVAYIYVPYIINTTIFLYYYFANLDRFTPWGDDGLAFGDTTDLLIQNVTTVIGLVILGLSIYFIVKWSREHNRSIDSQISPNK